MFFVGRSNAVNAVYNLGHDTLTGILTDILLSTNHKRF